jgi:hypothetical protein
VRDGRVAFAGRRADVNAAPAGSSTPFRMLSTIVQQIEAIQRDREMQFQRTAQIQADLDLLRAQLAKQLSQ